MPTLRRWEDIAAAAKTRGLTAERVEQLQRNYLDAWEKTEKPEAPAYAEQTLLAPRAAKYAEMQGRDIEALSDQAGDTAPRGTLAGLAQAVEAGARRSPAGMWLGAERPPFSPRGPAEWLAQAVPQTVLDPAFILPGGPATQFGVSALEHEYLTQQRRGETPGLRDLALAGAKGAATGALVGKAGAWGQKVSTRPVAQQIAKVGAETAALTGAQEAEQFVMGPPRTGAEVLEDVAQEGAKNAALMTVLGVLGGMRRRRAPQPREAGVEGAPPSPTTAEQTKPARSSEVPAEGPGEPGTGAGSTPPEPRFVRELQAERAAQQAAQDAAAETRYVEGVGEPREPIDLTEADVVRPRFVGDEAGDVIDAEVPVDLRPEDTLSVATVPPMRGGLPARQGLRDVPATPDQLAGEVVDAEIVDPLGEVRGPALPAPGEASDYIPPETYPREVQWQQPRGQSGPFPPRGTPGVPPEAPQSPVQPSAGPEPSPTPPAPAEAVQSARTTAEVRKDIQALEKRLAKVGAMAERVKLNAKIGRLKQELVGAEEAARKRLHEATFARGLEERVRAEAETAPPPKPVERPALPEPEQPVEGLEDVAPRRAVEEVVPPPVSPEPVVGERGVEVGERGGQLGEQEAGVQPASPVPTQAPPPEDPLAARRQRIQALREQAKEATGEERDRLDREITFEESRLAAQQRQARSSRRIVGEVGVPGSARVVPPGARESASAPTPAEGGAAAGGAPSEPAPTQTRRERQSNMEKRDRALLRQVEKHWGLDERLDAKWDRERKTRAGDFEKEAYLTLGRALEWRNRVDPVKAPVEWRKADAAYRNAQHEAKLFRADLFPEVREEYGLGPDEVPFDVPGEVAGRKQRGREPGEDDVEPPPPAPKKSRKGQRGALGAKQEKPVPFKLKDPEVDKLFPPLAPSGWRDRLRELPDRARAMAQSVKDRFGQIFEFEYTVKDQPALRNDLRLIVDRRGEVEVHTNRDLAQIVGRFERDGEYEQFRRLVALEDMAERAAAGQDQPRGLTFTRLQRAHDELFDAATPAVKTGIAMHRALMRQEAVEQVRRGVLHPDVLEKAIYYPHKIVELSNDLAERSPAFGRKLREPYRPWTHAAEGSERPIDMDYVGVMHSHLMRVRLANVMDDFAYTWLNKLDATDRLLAKERGKIVKAGQVFTEIGGEFFPEALSGGKPYETYAYRPGRQLSTEIGSKNSFIDAALDVLVPGEKYYVIPQNVARRFEEFRAPKTSTLLGEDFRAGWTLWKRAWVDALGVKFNVMNAIGDSLNLYRDDPRALVTAATRLPEIVRLLRGKGPHEIQRILNEQGITETATLFGAELDLSGAPRMLREFQKYGKKREIPDLTEAVRSAVGFVEQAMAKREQYLRIAKAMTDIERIQRGEQVVTKTVDIRGLEAEAAVGKVAREFAVDYAAVSPAFKGTVRGWLAPFSTWFIAQARDWPRYIKNHPGDAAVKFGAPLAALYYWNNVNQKDVERRNPEWIQRSLFHINTGYKTEDGRDVVLTYQTGLDVAAQIFQLDRLYQKLGRVTRGETPKWQDAKEFLTPKAYEIAEDAAKFGLRMAPIASLMTGLATGKDPFSQRPIVRQGMSQQEATKRLGWFAMQQVIPFLAQYETAMRRAQKRGTTGSKFLDFLKYGPIDLYSATGAVDVDPVMGELGVIHRNVGEATEHRAQKLEAIQRGVTEAETSGSLKGLRDAVAEGAKAGLSGKDIMRRLGSTTQQIEMLQARQATAKTPAEREAIARELRNLRVRLMLEGLKSKPKSARQAAGAP